MRNQNLPHGAAIIYQFIKELGGITDSQIDKLLGKESSNKEYYINYLKHSFIKEIQPGMYVSISSPKRYSKEMELCAWVLLNNDVSMELNDKDYYSSENPAQLFFQKDNKLYNLAYIDANRRNTLEVLQQLYFSRRAQKTDNDDSYQYLFVINDIKDLEMIQKAGLSVPMSIAYVHTENGAEPKIEYYSENEVENC